MSNITFTMIKPDAVANKHTGKIIDDIIAGGFSIKAMKYIHLSKEKAEAFYGIHRERPFFASFFRDNLNAKGGPSYLNKWKWLCNMEKILGAIAFIVSVTA